ncbi:hypothetical protein MGYG_04799 [Nannizzia gypsea CBS 118893]|uniref:Uncharacterized protein n=1 Tax=Arthroderma gypseum (strain ATCC MYA-4604 / CBS 118893) TaxID=535722 RepID=E4UWU5_ARTGP|nr:hypothetical protein MGYG_04799 [Nannizzia gypsea CBS 118893]EFR01798.1 hypothetical protein MGYG_04799 [Nannizzia gypsea CBS 118893]
MAPKRASQRGQPKSRARNQRRADTVESESELSADSGAEITNLLKKLNNTVAGRKLATDGRQKIQAHHKANVKKIEDRLKEVSSSNKKAILEYRKTQLERLSELANKKLEIEDEIAKHVLVLEKVYTEANQTIKAVVEEKIEILRE